MTKVVDNLQNPWSIAFLANGDFLITERSGIIRAVRGGRMDPSRVYAVPRVYQSQQGGLLDIVVHPDFERNRLVYFSYAKPDNSGSRATLAVDRAKLLTNRLVAVETIFEANAWGGGVHFGGRLLFNADLHLFVTVGDRYVQPQCLAGARLACSASPAAHPSQSLLTHAGKVIRVMDDGDTPPDNPFLGHPGALPEIWSYGHRNPQGLAMDSESDILWLTEHGPNGGDELNLVLLGRNYGWPVVGYGLNYDGTQIHQEQRQEGMEDPIIHWSPSFGPSSLLLYRGAAFPGWRGSLLLGGLVAERLVRLELRGRQVVSQEILLADFGRIRQVREAPDGSVYIVVDSEEKVPGAVYRLARLPD